MFQGQSREILQFRYRQTELQMPLIKPSFHGPRLTIRVQSKRFISLKVFFFYPVYQSCFVSKIIHLGSFFMDSVSEPQAEYYVDVTIAYKVELNLGILDDKHMRRKYEQINTFLYNKLSNERMNE